MYSLGFFCAVDWFVVSGGEERKYNQGPPETTNQSTAQKYQRVHKTIANNVEISTSDARNARISA